MPDLLLLFLETQAWSLGISLGGFLLGGGALHWWFYVRQPERAREWKLQPERWLSAAQKRRALWLGLANLAMMAAISSILLLVVSGSPPLNSRSLTTVSPFIARIKTPQPPGPGFPEHAPSVYANNSAMSRAYDD